MLQYHGVHDTKSVAHVYTPVMQWSSVGHKLSLQKMVDWKHGTQKVNKTILVHCFLHVVVGVANVDDIGQVQNSEWASEQT